MNAVKKAFKVYISETPLNRQKGTEKARIKGGR